MKNKTDTLYELYKKYEKLDSWYVALGMQQIDDLEPSNYLLKLISDFEKNLIDEESLEKKLYNYYEMQRAKNKSVFREYECDLVSSRMVKIIKDYKNFNFSEEYLKQIHKYLFKDVFVFAGTYRKTNLSKKEKILNGDTVKYSNYQDIEAYLNYDFNEYKSKEFSIENITDFLSNIWQIHPFNEGNTRTIIIFMLHYLQSLGYDLNYEFFKNDSKAFRNSLVTSNYENLKEKIYPDKEPLK